MPSTSNLQERLSSNGSSFQELTPPTLGTSAIAPGLSVPTYNSSSTAPSVSASTPPSSAVKGYDFNSDGKSDILWRNYATGQNVVWQMNGTTFTNGLFLTSNNDLNWKLEGTGDFTGDGKNDDLLWRNYATGQNVVWEMNGTTFANGIFLTSNNDLNWQISGTGDFNGDRKSDIVWRNYATGQNVVWEMNGTTFANGIFLTSNNDLNWQISGTGDFNGDGKSDLVWRNYATGQNAVWEMNGTTFANSLLLTSNNDLNWEIGLNDAVLEKAPNTVAYARDITVSSSITTYKDSVGSSDRNDYYKFTFGTKSDFNLAVNGLGANADVQLLNSSGAVIYSSVNSDTAAEGINTNLNADTYYIRVYSATNANTSYNLSVTTVFTAPSFSSVSAIDASGDNTNNTVFQNGAINFSYNLTNPAFLSNVRLLVTSNGNVVSTLGTWTGDSLSNQLINLANFSSLTGGDYQLLAVARTTNDQDIFSSSQAMKVLGWNQTNGTFAADTLNYSAGLGTGAVITGRGGTDTVDLFNVSRANVTSINGISLSAFNPLYGSTNNQAIFGGTAFDYLTLADGRELYFQGIENLKFSDGSRLELQVRTNDTYFGEQWNLHVSDVDSAWRFTQGSKNVLLVSLDTGILTQAGGSGGITDISTSRLITDPSDDDNYNDHGHGHLSTSIMSSTANNNSGIAGINWNSNVYINDVYNGVSLQQGIKDAISYARANNQRVVFQGGIQGEGWLNYGGTQAELEQLIKNNSDIAFFAVAAGNGGPGGNLDDPDYLTSVSGVAKLETTHSNVVSVGALLPAKDNGGYYDYSPNYVNNLKNPQGVALAPYSNRGSNLTLVAATNSPAMNKLGQMEIFGGTSSANPNMAGIASLVWSVNSNLDGGQVRQILVDTAMDLGTTGRDNTYGYGLVNADAAVRRSWALASNYNLANLYSSVSWLV
ncbi:FG-GAP repeat protein [Microcoleus sp. FACHB-831]|uniref:S8 family serine peptidase n=1 Tax=Microcoleus sp. FACHB-831 TaxID=2692827 RepID=UPI001684EDCA|nr:S8 family serine peptidase [Microcoleus sp. FACHB-831]MBD1924247.1 FG-GAP repeat protein [Microcoleus sp. FACHB-831]